MKINIDLNKLTVDELKIVVGLLDKKTVQEDSIQIEKPVFYRRRRTKLVDKVIDNTPKEADARIERMRFIVKKTRELMAIDNTLNYNMAFGRAAFMWKNRFTTYVPIKLEIWPLSEIGNSMLASSLKNLDNGSLTKIDFNYAVTNLAIRQDLHREWDINLWREFLNQLVRNSKQITIVLGKDAGSIFKIERYEGNDIITKR